MISREPFDPPLDRRTAVEFLKFIGECPDRFSFEDWNDALEPSVFSRVYVHGKPGRRERRILQRLEVLSHVVDDGFDEISSRAAGGLGSRIQLGRSHGKCLPSSHRRDVVLAYYVPRARPQFLWFS